MIRNLWGTKLTEIVTSIQEPNWQKDPNLLSMVVPPQRLGPIPTIEQKA